MSNLPSFCPLVESALLRMGIDGDVQALGGEQPLVLRDVQAGLVGDGHGADVRLVFSRPDTFGGPLLGLPHPAPSTTDSPTVVTLIARRNLRLIFPLSLIEEARRPA
jgi:hypothetical protein